MNLSEYVFARLWALKAFLVSWRSSQTRSLSDSNKWSRIRLHACSVLHTYILGDSPISLLRCFSLCFPRVTLEVTRARIVMNFFTLPHTSYCVGCCSSVGWFPASRRARCGGDDSYLSRRRKKKQPLALRLVRGMPEMSTFRLRWILNQWMSGQ